MEKNYNYDELYKILIELGLNSESAKYYAKEDLNSQIFAQVAAVRFVRPINNSIKSYKSKYMKTLRNRGNNPEYVQQLLDLGIDDLLSQFAHDIATTTANEILYRLSDPSGSDYDLSNEGMDLPSWKLMELDQFGKETERVLADLHTLLNIEK